MKLGPIQEAWLQSLEQHPERQQVYSLGIKSEDGSYKACCLGEGGLIAGVCEWNADGILFVPAIKDRIDSTTSLSNQSYKALGLRSPTGGFFVNEKHASLSDMNDHGKTWPEIAAFIRANPEAVFTHAV